MSNRHQRPRSAPIFVAGLMMLAGVSLMDAGPWSPRPALAQFKSRELVKDQQYDRAQTLFKLYASRPLKKGDNEGTWVDAERWCVAHAMLETNTSLDEANEYFSKVGWVSLNRGLVADTDIQVTDLLRTYLRFARSERLSQPAKDHLLKMFKAWTVPNIDRNRDADVRYEWPYFYTENHSLNILVASHLIDAAVFPNAPVRANKGTGALDAFLTDRLKYGWSEFNSPQYGLVTAKCLTMLTDFSPDPKIKAKAKALLDVMALSYAQQALHPYRGVPFVRGSEMRFSNRNNPFVDVAKFWFGDPTPKPAPKADGKPAEPALPSPFLIHLMDSDYRPVSLAQRMIQTRRQTGPYTVRQTMLTGLQRQRVPVVTRVTSQGTLASAQGSGHFYDGGFWMLSSAASPDNVITGSYGNNDRNLFQYHNMLMVFGTIDVRGGFTSNKHENLTVYTDGSTRVAVVSLPGEANLLVMDESTSRPVEMFIEDVSAMSPAFDPQTGKFTFNGSEKLKIEVHSERDGAVYRLQRVVFNGENFQIDKNFLFDSDELRSEFGTGSYQARCFGQTWEYQLPGAATPITWNWARLLPDQTSNAMGMMFNYVPAGAFPMGSPRSEGRADEGPVRWVDLPGFYMGTHEVTVGQWKAFMRANPEAGKMPDWWEREAGKAENAPVTYITREQAQAFCEWLSKADGFKYRLPTEAEWEKAARGWSYRIYPWGDRYDRTQSGYPNTTYGPIGGKPKDVSPFGCMDMAGNVWEWTSDNYSYYEKDGVIYGQEMPGFEKKTPWPNGPVVRGCGWNYDPETFRCAYRSSMPAGGRSLHVGFRVVCDPALGVTAAAK